MVIIVEGIDQVGKTTLCTRLSEVTGFPIFKDQYRYSITKENSTEKILTTLQMLEIFDKISQGIIVDRLHLTEYSYGKNDRKYVDIDLFKEIDKRISSLKSSLILVEPDSYTTMCKISCLHEKNFMKHHHDFKRMFNLSNIAFKFTCNWNNFEEVTRIINLISNYDLKERIV